MTEKEFFLKLFPQVYELLPKEDFIDFDGNNFDKYFVNDIEELNVPRHPNEGPVCECVGKNTNNSLVLYHCITELLIIVLPHHRIIVLLYYCIWWYYIELI